MDYPLYGLRDGEGVLRVTPMGQETCFEVINASSDLHRVYIQGRRGQLLLGVMEQGQLRRRFSHTLTEPIGELLCGRAESWREKNDWGAVPQEVRTSWGTLPPETLYQRCSDGYQLALPYNERQPFGLTELFCFACMEASGRRAIFTFDAVGNPLIPQKK